MKKLLIMLCLFAVSGCAHVSETIVGYNEEGKTIVQICKSRGNLANSSAFGSSCKIEERNYGRISNKSNTLNVISTEAR